LRYCKQSRNTNCYICGFAVVFHYAVGSPNEISERKSEKLFRSFDRVSIISGFLRNSQPARYSHGALSWSTAAGNEISLSLRNSKSSVVCVSNQTKVEPNFLDPQCRSTIYYVTTVAISTCILVKDCLLVILLILEK